MDYYNILNVQRDCSIEELRRAFRRLSLSAHPDRFQGEDRVKAEREYQFIAKAFNTLKDPSQRKKYDQSLAKELSSPDPKTAQSTQAKEAQQYEKAGVTFYRRGQFEHAIEYLSKAAYLAPNGNVYYYKGLAESKVYGKKKDAMTSLQKAVETDVYQIKYRLAMVECLFEMGLKTKAQKSLLEALSLFPSEQTLLDLQGKLFGIQEEKGTLVKGLFSVFRGKH